MIDIGSLRQFCVSLCQAYGIKETHAKIMVESLIDADMRGKQTHGLMRLAPYLNRIVQGLMDGGAEPKIEHDTGPMLHINGQNAIGAVIADFSVRTVIERSVNFGISAAIVDHGNHIGALGYWSRNIAKADCFGIVVSDGSPRLPASGGMEGVVGNNPWSIAVPTENNPIVMDLANSIAAAGKIRKLQAENKPVPEGWALNKEGVPTADPIEALKGILLPMAGYKGYAISFMMALLTNGLSGAESINNSNVDDMKHQQNVSNLYIAINPRILYGSDWNSFFGKTNDWIKRIKNSKKMPGVAEIFVPGEQSDILFKQSQSKNGINIATSTLEALNNLAREVEHLKFNA